MTARGQFTARAPAPSPAPKNDTDAQVKAIWQSIKTLAKERALAMDWREMDRHFDLRKDGEDGGVIKNERLGPYWQRG